MIRFEPAQFERLMREMERWSYDRREGLKPNARQKVDNPMRQKPDAGRD